MIQPDAPGQEAIVADAFSRVAARYDGFVDDHPHLTAMRLQVTTCVARHLPTGSTILELNAGTGIDAETLALAGFRMHATDIAPEMLERARARAAALPKGSSMTVQETSLLDLSAVEGGPFDAVLSNFGGLNCVDDLAMVARNIDGVLRPGGTVVAVVMPPICLWELIYLLVGRLRFATRRLRPGGTTAHLEGRRFTVHYSTPGHVRRSFGDRYAQVECRGLSVITPRGDAQFFSRKHPRLYRALSWVDERLAPRRPWSGWGDYFIIVLRRADPVSGIGGSSA